MIRPVLGEQGLESKDWTNTVALIGCCETSQWTPQKELDPFLSIVTGNPYMVNEWECVYAIP